MPQVGEVGHLVEDLEEVEVVWIKASQEAAEGVVAAGADLVGLMCA